MQIRAVPMWFMHKGKLSYVPEKMVKVLENSFLMYSALELLLHIGKIHHPFAKMVKELDLLVLVKKVPESLGHVAMCL